MTQPRQTSALETRYCKRGLNIIVVSPWSGKPELTEDKE